MQNARLIGEIPDDGSARIDSGGCGESCTRKVYRREVAVTSTSDIDVSADDITGGSDSGRFRENRARNIDAADLRRERGRANDCGKRDNRGKIVAQCETAVVITRHYHLPGTVSVGEARR